MFPSAVFDGFHKILSEFIAPEGATITDFRILYQESDMNQKAIMELCSCNVPYKLDMSLFEEGAPGYYFGRESSCAPFGMTLGKHTLVTTVPGGGRMYYICN